MEGLRKRGVLVGITGPAGNVIKIRPPIVFEERHADVLTQALQEVLEEWRRSLKAVEPREPNPHYAGT